MPLRLIALILLGGGVLAACGGSAGNASADAAANDAPATDAVGGGGDAVPPADAGGGDGGWGPAPTGYHFFFDLGAALLMGQTVAFGVGGFMPTAREDLAAPRAVEIPLGECVTSPAALPPECATAADCAPEQQCLPEKDDQGKPIAGTESCVTDRALMDVGPFTVTGFASGALEFAYNAGQSGAYTTANPGDGQVPPEEVVYDATYTISGTGDSAQGIGAFTGTARMPPAIALTSPELVTLPIGFPGIKVSVSQDLVITWSGNDPAGEIMVTLTGGGSGGTSIVCRVTDSGTLTIPQAQVAAANFGNMALVNMLTLERKVAGTASGDGLTNTRVSTTQTLTYNVAKQP